MIFASSAQAAAFAKACGLSGDEVFLDGRAAAAQLGVELPAETWKPSIPLKRRLAAVARPVKR
jgi:hypothetical protein